ncbi:putative peroxiredoxin, OsmC-like protein [Gottschalkia acidurici 9a]|uniref:Peroxiredoxin, OsmC-like protein n=1 Tax=Gottschalkia acidurici (strain ATCC 7906 / DSM 604 / BCRC 14475 / CIP 104303 / KCTC 5404 / NCIMB 10678 / 9a) TaxID=1128398 RepID=K0B3Z9_GOTA9|nr:OsmC family protein [Gottschalkia acidurici]AFS79650.1 putative peroxiredoxin, OsmC-like protein [Gottschalkia acidurici 9a]
MADIVVNFPGGKKVNAKIGDFEIKTDQLEESGGENSAPSPFELFLSSLATCTGVAVLSFCQTREINTEGLKIELDVTKDEKGNATNIKTHLTLPKGFPDKYKESVERIAGTCKVKRHILNPPKFELEVK